jgi:hypothetical protein
MTFCRMEKHCIVFDASQDLPGLAHQNPLCYACRDQAMLTILSLRLDYVDLTQMLPPADSRNDMGKIFRPKPESQAPVNEAALNLRTDIAAFAALATQNLRRALQLGLYRPQATREGFQLDADVRFLAARVSELAELGEVVVHDPGTQAPYLLDGVGLIELAGTLHRKARRLCGLEPQVVQVPGFCPACNAAALRRHDDNDEKVWCQVCSHRVTLQDIVQLARLNLPPHA